MKNKKTNKCTALQLQQYSLVNDTDAIEKMPLKIFRPKQKIIIRGDVAYLKAAFLVHFAGFLLTLIVYAGWGFVFYGLYNRQFYIKSDAGFLVDIIATLFLFLGLLMLTIGNWFIKKDLKNSSYINRDTGIIKNDNNKKDYILQDILCIQLLNYVEEIRERTRAGVSSTKKITIYQINLVTHSKDRFALFQNTKEHKAVKLCEKLSKFINKPFVNHLTKKMFV